MGNWNGIGWTPRQEEDAWLAIKGRGKKVWLDFAALVDRSFPF